MRHLRNYVKRLKKECFNTAIGYHPMRHPMWVHLNRILKELQYRNRVSPHAASGAWTNGNEINMFQYRSRVTPFAASEHDRAMKDQELFQYRSRVTPFAASAAGAVKGTTFLLQYRNRASPHAAPRGSPF